MEINKILEGDCIKVLKKLPDESVDLVFADPPYNLQLKKKLVRPDNSKVSAVNDDWDKFASFGEYDESSSQMGEKIRKFLDEGCVNIVGGCCGTTPDHIKVIAEIVNDFKPRKK